MQVAPEAFLLLTLPNCTLSSTGFSETGALGLECVTLLNPEASSANERDVYLVLRLNLSETPIDPARVIRRSDKPGSRTYTFYSIPTDPSEFILTIPAAAGDSKTSAPHEDLNAFDGILEQYANDFRTESQTGATTPSGPPPAYVADQKDLRGHLVMINEDTGEVVGEVEDRFRINEDPLIHQPGHENDPVMIEVPDEAGLRESDATAIEVFARIVPPDQQDWITKSATVVSHAISYTTNLVLTAITTASDYYVSHSRASTPHSSATVNENQQSSGHPYDAGTNPPPLPPRALVFLTSERTRQGLRSVHTVSTQAVKVSAKTVKTIDNMIRRAMGAKPKRPRLTGYTPTPPGSLAPVPSASNFTLAPTAVYPSHTSHTQQWNSDSKPPLPPRRTPSPQPPPLPPRYSPSSKPPSLPPRSSIFDRSNSAASLQPQTPANSMNPSTSHAPKISKTSRVLISADLILSTIDDSARRILDTSTTSLGRVMHHKYGPEAAESSLLAAGTARNVGLVYVDMRGIGRRALLRRAGMNYVKAQFHKNESNASGGHTSGGGNGRPVPPVPQKQ